MIFYLFLQMVFFFFLNDVVFGLFLKYGFLVGSRQGKGG